MRMAPASAPLRAWAVPAPAPLRACFTRILRGGQCPHPPRFARGQCPHPPRFARGRCPHPPRFASASTAFFGRRALECGVGAQSPSPGSMPFRSGGRPSETHLAQWAPRSRHPAKRFRGGFHGQGTEKKQKKRPDASERRMGTKKRRDSSQRMQAILFFGGQGSSGVTSMSRKSSASQETRS